MMTNKILFSFVVALVMTGSLAKGQDVPIASWSGRLVLPVANERRSDGGVYIEIQNAPAAQTALIGKKLWVRFSSQEGSVESARFSKQTKDVTFNKAATINKDHLNLPVRLNGWKSVSPLESLAGAHAADDVTAELIDPQVQPGAGAPTLVISQDPVILDGSRQALVTFIREIDAGHHVVQHYNPSTKRFDGPTETITLNFQREIDDKAESEGLKGIEKHAENAFGWNIYGDRVNGAFSLKALEPHRLSVVETNSFDGTYKSLSQLQADDWRIDANTINKIRKTSLPLEVQKAPQVGDKYLVVHGFGAWNDNGQFFGFYQGHAALGEATIVRHPISGELMADVVYTQIYCHSNRGVVAGQTHAHAYTGDLYRGRMFYRPINDVLVSWPRSFTETFSIGGRSTTLAAELLRDLNDMARDYRIGFGHGLDQITVVSSCAHDSGNVLIKTLIAGRAALSKAGKSSLANELDSIASELGPVVEPPAEYRDADLIPANMETLGSTRSLVQKNMTIVAPRNFQDATVKGFGKLPGARVYALLSVQVASDMTNAVPHAPDTITMSKIIFRMLKSKLGIK